MTKASTSIQMVTKSLILNSKTQNLSRTSTATGNKEVGQEMEHKQTSSAIHYFVSDSSESKETILFIHPAFADHRAFDEQLDFFGKDYKIITMDLLGHGLSQGFKTEDKIHDTSKHISEILKNEGIEKVHLIGVSIGAVLAQDFANKHPEKVSSLVSLGGYDINNYDQSIEKAQRKQQASFLVKALFSMKAFARANSKFAAYTEPPQEKLYQNEFAI